MIRPKTLSVGFLVLACLLGRMAAASPSSPAPDGRVVSDIDPLRSVIVLSPSAEDRKETYALYEDSPFPSLLFLEGMARQHAGLSKLLRKNGVRTLSVVDLLESAVNQARSEGKLEAALQEIFPDQFPRLRDKISRITARVLLARDPDFFFNYDPRGGLDPLVPTSGAFCFTRDFAVSTPRGIILTNSRSVWRKNEHRLGRFMFGFAPELSGHPIVFDAEAEGVHCEGGDIIVKDEHSLLMGIGNFSDREAAARIARKLDLDVIGVAMPSFEKSSGLNFEIMHLDTVFNLVDAKKVLTVPCLFLKKYASDHPVVKYLQAVQNRPKKEPERGEFDFPSSFKTALDSIAKVGWLTLFKAGTGEAADLGQKLGDYLLDQGCEIIPVGGEQDGMRDDQYLDDRVLYELSLQGANIVQLGPGKIIAYAHNTHTNEALRKRGIKVLTFEGKYLADAMGGPHCLTMPLVRGRAGR